MRTALRKQVSSSPPRVISRLMIRLGLSQYVSAFIMACMTLTIAPITSFAQGDPVIYQDWTHLAERSTLVDIMVRVVQCDASSDATVQVMVFNENAMDQTVTFSVTLSDGAQSESFTFDNYQIPMASMHQPDCATNTYPDLILSIPDGFSAETLVVTAAFEED